MHATSLAPKLGRGQPGFAGIFTMIVALISALGRAAEAFIPDIGRRTFITVVRITLVITVIGMLAAPLIISSGPAVFNAAVSCVNQLVPGDQSTFDRGPTVIATFALVLMVAFSIASLPLVFPDVGRRLFNYKDGGGGSSTNLATLALSGATLLIGIALDVGLAGLCLATIAVLGFMSLLSVFRDIGQTGQNQEVTGDANSTAFRRAMRTITNAMQSVFTKNFGQIYTVGAS